MAGAVSGCVMGEQKRDFDLQVVLDYLKATLKKVSKSMSEQDATANQGIGYTQPCANPAVQAKAEDGGYSQESIHLSDEKVHPTAYQLDGQAKAQSVEAVLYITPFLKAFHELTRFFKLTGPVFMFVANDLNKKISMIEKRLSDPTVGHHYSTLEGMIAYEQNEDLVMKKSQSTSRTFLRLYWALEFIIEFMDKLREADEQTKTSHLVLDVYSRTLSLHHPWLTRKLASIAVYTLPTIKVLIDLMCKHDYTQVLELLKNVVDIGTPVIKHIFDVYNREGLSDIP